MTKNLDYFKPGITYHVFNRTNNKERLFTQTRNYQFFLDRFCKYLSPVLKIYAYCLLKNHFHFLIKVESEETLKAFSKKDKPLDPHTIVSRQFKNFFTSYSKAFNKQENRYGSLFQRPFKRKAITSEVQFGKLIYYIHANPQLHKSSIDYKKYQWSSYTQYINDVDTIVEKEEILDWFGGVKYFLNHHEEEHEMRTLDDSEESW